MTLHASKSYLAPSDKIIHCQNFMFQKFWRMKAQNVVNIFIETSTKVLFKFTQYKKDIIKLSNELNLKNAVEFFIDLSIIDFTINYLTSI